MKECDSEPNVVTYSILIRMFSKNNDMKIALDLLEEMKSNAIVPNEFAYSSLINQYIKVKDIEKIIVLFEDMKYNNIKPNLYIYITATYK